MKILIFGAGAVGSYVGARLAHARHEVTLVMRPAAAAAVNNIGLAVTEGSQHFLTRPTAVASLRQALLEDQQYDLFILTMKSYDVDQAINEMMAFAPDPPPFITMQNGIGIEEKFATQFGAERVIAGSLTVPISLDATNSVQVERVGRGVALSPLVRKQDIGRWVGLMQTSGMTTQHVKEYRSMKWSKAFVNIIANATSAILNRHPSVLYKNNLTFQIELAMLREALRVMKREKVKPLDLPGAPAGRLARALRLVPQSLLKPIIAPVVAGGRGDKMPSFHMDLANGKKVNEVVFHNGAIAAAGSANGVPVPVNAALNDILMQLARREIPWETYSGKPKRLAAEIQARRVQARG